jgi:hypothetical protein
MFVQFETGTIKIHLFCVLGFTVWDCGVLLLLLRAYLAQLDCLLVSLSLRIQVRQQLLMKSCLYVLKSFNHFCKRFGFVGHTKVKCDVNVTWMSPYVYVNN